MGKIHLLKKDTIEKIAAGEVVERPASVIKELIENSLDARAKHIWIQIKTPPGKYLSVRDDGEGMSKEDAELALHRFATSKITSFEDFEKISSLGFRGEALPTIAAVSKMSLLTRTKENISAWKIQIEGGKIINAQEAGAPPGTQVIVQDLFYNTPARLKFLKSERTERGQIFQVINNLALAFPKVGFYLTVDQKEILKLPPEKDLRSRISSLYGYSVEENFFPLKYFEANLQIFGLFSFPQSCLLTKRHQFISVNNRPIRSPLLMQAIYQAYQKSITGDKHPQFFLYIQCPGKLIDVNVHPTKREIRFMEGEKLYSLLNSLIKNKLGTPAVIPQKQIASFPSFPKKQKERKKVTKPLEIRDLFVEIRKEKKEIKEKEETFVTLQILPLGQLGKSYILAQNEEGLIIIDQHAASERIVYEKFKKAQQEGKIFSQTLLSPLTLHLSPIENEILKDYQRHFQNLGFEIEEFGKNSYLLRSVPALLAEGMTREVFLNILDKLNEGKESKERNLLSEEIEEKIIRSACHQAIRAQDKLQKEEMVQLIEELKQCAHPYTCPHGRPVLIKISYKELEERFSRR